MSDIVSNLLQWLNAHPQLAGLVTFIISAAESVAIIGTIVPGSIMMTALGTLAGSGVIPLWETIFWAIMGAIVGDGISYWIGHYFKDRLPHSWPFRHYPALLKTGENFVHKYGSMSVFIGRFVGPVRALVPLVAGMLGMKPLQFTLANVTSAIGWAPAYMFPGILLGAASQELPPDIAIQVILVLFLTTLFSLLCLWLVYKFLHLIHAQTTQLQNRIWLYLQESRHLSVLSIILKYPSSQKMHGQLNLALYFVLSSILFITLILYVKYVGPAEITINQIIFHLFRGIRSHCADDIFLNITLLGQKEVVLPIFLTVSAWFWYRKRTRAALHIIGLAILMAGSIYLIKNCLHSLRPWGILQSPDTYSMPSGHSTLSATLYIGLAYIFSHSFKKRAIPYSIALVIVFLVGISRLYLGAHWLTDILSAWILSAALLLVVIISYQRQIEKKCISSVGVFLVSFATLCAGFGVFHYKHFIQLQSHYSQMDFLPEEISIKNWWKNNGGLSAYRTSLFGFPSQQINIEWAGDIEQIRTTLLNQGWAKPPPRDFISTLHRIADVKSTQYLPMVSPQYLDKKPAIILTRRTTDGKKLLVLRLWDANRLIKETHTTLWVGFVAVVPRSYNWLFKYNVGYMQIDPLLIFPKKSGTGDWQSKTIVMKQSVSANHIIQQKIMLIRLNNSVHKKK